MGDFQSPKTSIMQESKVNRSSYDFDNTSQTRTIDRGGLRLPNTNVNQAKLKIILKQLKKMDR